MAPCELQTGRDRLQERFNVRVGQRIYQLYESLRAGCEQSESFLAIRRLADAVAMRLCTRSARPNLIADCWDPDAPTIRAMVPAVVYFATDCI